eukprot:2465539-Amphidinium_carterae.1
MIKVVFLEEIVRLRHWLHSLLDHNDKLPRLEMHIHGCGYVVFGDPSFKPIGQALHGRWGLRRRLLNFICQSQSAE